MPEPLEDDAMSLQVVHPNAAGIDMATRPITWRYHRTGTRKRCGDSTASRRI